MAAVVAAEGDLDQVMVRAAQILASLRSKKLRAWPEWVPKPEAESSPGTAPLEVPEGWAVVRRPRSRGRLRRGSFVRWRKALRDLNHAGSGGEERDAALAATGSGSPSTSSADQTAPTRVPSPSHADDKALAAAEAAAAEKEPMAASSPVTPLHYSAGGSGASSDDAARPGEKRKEPGARGSGGEDDEGCSSPSKLARAPADEVKPIPTNETSTSSARGFAFDLNLPPPFDDSDCPDAC